MYGTLQRGASAWHLLKPLIAEQEGTTVLPGTLYDTARGYPALVLGEGSGVSAQVFRLRDPASALPILDDYEGSEYDRLRIRLDDGTCCWVYAWRGSAGSMRPLPRGWLS